MNGRVEQASAWIYRGVWRVLVEPVAEHVVGAMGKAMPEEAKAMAGPLIGMLGKAGGAMFGSQVGAALGGLAGEVLTASDIGLTLGRDDGILRAERRRQRRFGCKVPDACLTAPPASDREPIMVPSRNDYVTYREWRERGETVFGAASRTVPFQYVWAVMALLVLLAVMYLKPLVKFLLS